jgi:hypothetical protein
MPYINSPRVKCEQDPTGKFAVLIDGCKRATFNTEEEAMEFASDIGQRIEGWK